MRTFFDRVARRYDRSFAPSAAETAADLLGVLADVPRDGVALDVGCGTGRAWPVLLSHPLRVIAFDASAPMLVEAARRSSAHAVARLRSDLYQRWPVSSACADLVMMLHSVLAHPPASAQSAQSAQGNDAEACAAAWRHVGLEVRRVSRAGARIAIDLPDPSWARAHLRSLGGDRYLHEDQDVSIVAVIPEPSRVLEALDLPLRLIASGTGVRALGNL